MSVEVAVLANGMRVISETMPHLESAAIGVWVDAGARHESEAVNGVSHLLEHMAFKGTERRSAQQIAEEIEAVGGHINAYTSREHTAYFVRVLKQDVGLAIDILGDILQHSTFDDRELARERDVVIQEIGQAEDTPDDIIFDHLQAVSYPGQAMGRSILGTVERVRGFDRPVLAAHMDRHYRTPRMVMVAAGALTHAQVCELAEQAFSDLGNGADPLFEQAMFTAGDYREDRALEQVHMVMGFDGLSYGDERFYAYQVLSTLLGGGMSSRLFQELRERRGLCYSVFSFAASYVDGGMFGVYAGTGEEQIGELIEVLAGELHRVGEDAEDSEIARARAQMKAGLLMSLESPSARIEQLARQMLIYGRIVSTDEIVAKVDAVDVADVRAVANAVLRRRPALAALGPIGALASEDVLAAKFTG